MSKAKTFMTIGGFKDPSAPGNNKCCTYSAVRMRSLRSLILILRSKKTVLRRETSMVAKRIISLQARLSVMLQNLNILAPRKVHVHVITTSNILSEWECQSPELLHAIMF